MSRLPDHPVFSKITFWVVLFFLVRLVGITNPPLEISHNWRQSTGLMVARNFMEVDANILYPRVDDTAGATGIIGMEFPLLNYLHFICAEVFGYTHWYGRLINLIVSSFGVYCFGRLIQRYWNNRTALAAVIALSVSIWFAFSRKMMADTFSISLVFIALFGASKYLANHQFRYLFFFMLFSSAGVLAKIPAGIYLASLLPMAFDDAFSQRSKNLLASAVIPVGLAAWWYFSWNPYLSETFGTWYNSGQALSESTAELSEHLAQVLERFTFSAFHGFILFGAALAGLIMAVVFQAKKMLVVTGVLAVPIVLYILRSGFYFHHHDYYIIPVVPVMALLAGYAIASIQRRLVFVLLLGLCMAEGIGNQQHDFFIKDSERYKMTLPQLADAVSTPEDLVAIAGNGNHQELYLLHRKGWIASPDALRVASFRDTLQRKGCQYVFVNRHRFDLVLPLPVAEETEHYSVYALR